MGHAVRVRPIDGDFLLWDPFDAVEQGQAHRVPFIVGRTADEATVFNRFVKVLPTTASAIERALAEVDPPRAGALLTLLGDRSLAQRVSDDKQSRALAFCQTGHPGPDWPPYNDVDRPLFIFTSRSRVDFDPHLKRREAWDFKIPS